MKPIPTRYIGQAIVERREEIGISGGELSRRMEVDRASVSRWENGFSKTMRVETLYLIANALDISAHDLLGRAEKLRSEDI